MKYYKRVGAIIAMNRVGGVVPTTLVMLLASCAMSSTTLASLPEFRKVWKFSITGGAQAVFKTTGNEQVTCGSSSGRGEVGQIETKVAKAIRVVFTGCTYRRENCTTAFLRPGEIELHAEGELGYIEPAVRGAETVAFALSSSGNLAEFSCVVATIKLEGCVVGALSRANVETEEFKLKFEETNGIQKYLSLEPEFGKKRECKLKVRLPLITEEGGIEMTDTLKAMTSGEKEEVKS